MLKAEPPADVQEAALGALGTRGSSACIGVMQSSSALGTDAGCPFRSTGEMLTKLGMEEQL